MGRRLSIDGAVPFAEAACLRFPYTSRWDLLTAADGEGEPYLFYLPAGTHTLRLEAVLGELAPIIRQLNDVIYSLNQWYRKIIMITSTSADKYRDYNLDREIPGLLEGLTDCANRLRDGYNAICAVAGGEAAECAILMTTVRQLESFVSEPRTIPYRITSFQSNIGSVSAWVLDIRNQPLMLDYFLLWQGGGGAPQNDVQSMGQHRTQRVPVLLFLCPGLQRVFGQGGGQKHFSLAGHRAGSGRGALENDHRPVHPQERHPCKHQAGQRHHGGGVPVR